MQYRDGLGCREQGREMDLLMSEMGIGGSKRGQGERATRIESSRVGKKELC